MRFFAAFSITVIPFAVVAASIALIVAPTVITSKKIFPPERFSAEPSITPFDVSMSAPSVSNAFIC